MSAPAAPRRPRASSPAAARPGRGPGAVVPPDRVTAVFGRYLLTGDEEALDDVVRSTRPRLLAAARRIGNPADAEDSVQTAFLSLIRHRGAPFDAPVMPWLLTAVVRTAYRRKAAARREAALAERLALVADAADADPAALVGDGADVARLRAEIARLPDRYRDPVVLHHVQGLSTAETARLLDVPEATVRTRLRRARALVRTRWNPRTAAALLALPWLLADLGRGGSAGAGAGTALAAGGLMQLSTALPLAVVVALGVGALLGRTVLSKGPDVDAAHAPDAAAARVAELEAKVRTLEQELGGRASRLASAPAREPSASATSAASPGGAATGATPAPKPDEARPAGARIVVPGFEASTDGVDWPVVGKNLSAMPPLLAKILVLDENDQASAIELGGALQAHNGPLVMAAGVVAKAMKVKNPNLAFTHPVFQANALVAVLEATGRPLSDAQIAALTALARQCADDETSRAARYGERTLEVTKLIDQAEVRDRFYEGMRALLTPEQRASLGSDEYRGRLQADLYSSGLLWATVTQALPATDRAQLIASFTPRFLRVFGLPDASAAELGKLVDEWARETPDEFFTAEPDPKDAKGLLRVSAVTDAARRQAVLEEKVIDRLRLDDATIAKIRAVGIVLVPFRVVPTK